jgi:paraquat-inducible protein B
VSSNESIVTQTKYRVSRIWIVPVVAVILGLWLVVSNYLSQGPTVEVSFESASGIEVGKTKIKVLNVEIGTVTDVRINDEASGVIATAELDPEARKLIREDTEFWIVKPSISGLNVSGLSTLLSGAYIELSPGVEAISRERRFTGESRRPAAPPGTPGIRLRLTSRTSGSFSIGSPVLYKGFRVGSVEDMNLDTETHLVNYSIFIDAPYNNLVTSNSRFWDASGISAQLNSEGIKVVMNSMQSLLTGGVAFDTPKNYRVGNPAMEYSTYRLFPNENSIHENPHRNYAEFVVGFKQSLRGLHSGALVTYKGIQIGSVVRIMIDRMDSSIEIAANGQPIPVLIRIDPGRFNMGDLGDTPEGAVFARETVDRAVTNGLRATLQSGNIITGAQLIGLDFHDDAGPIGPRTLYDYPRIPAIDSGFGRIQIQVSTLLNKLNTLPLEDTVAGANTTIDELSSTLAAARTILEDDSTQDITDSLLVTLDELNHLIQSYSENSEFQTELNRTLVEVKNALNSLQGVTDRLADKPNSVIFPSEPNEDPEPKAPR